jgi:hypothetical protein
MVGIIKATWAYLQRLARWPVPDYTRFGLYSQAILVVGCVFSFQWWPVIPTVALGFLSVVAVVMTVRADRFSHGERVVYVLIAFALFAVEMKAIYAERDQHDEEQAELRRRESETRKRESESFATLIEEGHGLFQSIQHVDTLAQESLENITGGKSFAAVTPQVWSGMVPIPLSIYNYGKQTLTGVTVNIYGKEEWDRPRGFFDAPTINVGTLHAGEMKLLKESITPSADRGFNDNGLKVDRFQIHIAAQNFTVVEYLDFRQGKKIPWTFRYQVTRQFVKSRHGKTTNFGYEIMANVKDWLGEN